MKKTIVIIFFLGILFLLVAVVFRPVLSNIYVTAAKKSARGQFVCSINEQGKHEGRLYKFTKGKKILSKKFEGESCIFSKPKVNAGFFVLLIGGGGGATPYENGNNGQIISKHKNITKQVIVIQVGKGGNGTYFDGNKLIDAKDGTSSFIKDIDMSSKGGVKSTRMTPRGTAKNESKSDYILPEKYRYLYDIQFSAKYGAGGVSNKKLNNKTAKAQGGQNGVVIIQW